MAKKVLILSSSPRRGGNSDTLCDEFMRGVQSAKPPVHLFKTKRFYFEVLFQNEASLLEQNQTAFKWTSNPI